MTARYYTQFYLSGLVSCLALIAGFNWLIDPQGVFRILTLPGINQEKPLLEKEGVRKTKSIDLERGAFKAVVLGTSRSFGGLDPEHPKFAAGTAYNAALPGTNFYETHKVFEFASQHLSLQQVVLELDFTTFSDKRTVDADFEDSRFAGKTIWVSSLGSLVSLYHLQDAWTTLQFNRQGQAARYTTQGFRRDRTYGEGSSDRHDHHRLFAWADQQYLSIHTGLDYDSRDRTQRLQAIVEQSQANDIELYLFIPPLHAHLIESLALTGLMPEFEQWKRDLVQLVADHNQAYPNRPPLRLWDFSGISSVTTEPVPPEGSDEKMQWYIESSHFTPELGDIMLDMMLSYPDRPAAAPDDFGIVLTPQNLETQLAQMRSGLRDYEQNHADDIRDLKALHNAILN